MKLSDYSFGSIKIDGQNYTSDVIVYNDYIEDWWRESGHQVVPADLEKIIRRSPDKIIFGSGANGRMTLTGAAEEFLADKKVDYQIHRTEKAVKAYNKALEAGEEVAAALHLTC